MGFFDRLGDAFGAVSDKAKVGLSWAAATSDDAGKAVHGFNTWAHDNVVGWFTDPVRDNIVTPTLEAAAVPAGYVNRGISTALQVDSAASAGGGWDVAKYLQIASDRDRWGQAWDRAQNISAGQALTIDMGGTPDVLAAQGIDQKDPFGDQSAEARAKFFTDTWAGKLESGAADFAVAWYGDPLVVAGKLGKAAALNRITVKPGEAEGVVAAASGAADVTRREGKLGDRMAQLITKSDKLSAAEMAALPEFKNTADAGALAYFFDRANKSYPGASPEAVASRQQLKRDVWGAMLGDSSSIARVVGKQDMLAAELRRMGETPETSKWSVSASFDDYGQGALFKSNETTPSEILAQRKGIESELDRLDRVIVAAATGDRVGSTLSEAARYRATSQTISEGAAKPTPVISSIAQSDYYTGLGSRPVRVVTAGATANRLPGHVSTRDPVVGYDQLQATLATAKHLDGAARQGLLDKFVKAASDGDRQGVIRETEARVLASTAKAYGVAPEQARQVINGVVGRRDSWRQVLKSRLYSAAPEDKFVPLHDPETDDLYAFSRPLLRSQIEDNVPILDPQLVDKWMKIGTSSRRFERLFPAADKAYDVKDTLGDLGSSALMSATKIWKDSALVRGAYPLRIQVDSQFRLLTHMGTAAYFAQGAQKSKALYKMLSTSDKDGAGFFRKFFGTPDYEASLGSMMAKAGFPEEDVQRAVQAVIAKDGGTADLLSELSDAELARVRMDGEWGPVDPTDRNWAQSWSRAVNRQIRNSPVALKAAEGSSVEDLRRFVKDDPAGRGEWLELSGSNNDDLDGWLQNVQAHVNHYLPQADMKSTIVKRNANATDVKKWFGELEDQRTRMRVHGEAYSPTRMNPIAARYNEARKGWYQFASDAPETVLARAPLYAWSFKKNLREIVERLPDDYISSEAMDSARKSADRMARREMGQVLFDASHTSNLAHTFRYVAPFFAAWEDMGKKWGSLFYEKPWAIERAAQMWRAPNAAGIVTDENGNIVDPDGTRRDAHTRLALDPVKDKALIGKNEYVHLPASILGPLKPDGVGELRINKKSFNIVFQGDPFWLPGAGPIVQVPVNQLVRSSFPEAADNPVIAAILPHGPTDAPIDEQLVPSWVRQVKSAMGDTQDYSSTYAMLYAQEQSRFLTHERDKAPDGEEIANMTRNWFIMRAVSANLAPVSIQPTGKLQFYTDQAHIYRQKYGQTQQSPEYKAALEQYKAQWGDHAEDHLLVDHPEYEDWQSRFAKDFPGYFDMSLSLSSNQTGIVATDAAVKELKNGNIRKLVSQDPQYGWMFVGPANTYGETGDSKYSYGAAAFLGSQAMGYGNPETFRGKVNPTDALEKVEASRGWEQYSKLRTLLNIKMDEIGAKSLNEKKAAPLKAVLGAFVQDLGSENESWRRDYTSRDSGKVVDLLTTANKAMAQDKYLASRPDMQALQQYQTLRGKMQEILATREKKTLAGNADLDAVWQAFTSELVRDNLGFEQIYNRVLEHDDLKGEVPNAN